MITFTIARSYAQVCLIHISISIDAIFYVLVYKSSAMKIPPKYMFSKAVLISLKLFKSNIIEI